MLKTIRAKGTVKEVDGVPRVEIDEAGRWSGRDPAKEPHWSRDPPPASDSRRRCPLRWPLTPA